MTRLDWALTHNVPHSVVRIAGDVVSILSLGLWTPKWADRFSDWRFAKAVGVDLRTLEAELDAAEYLGVSATANEYQKTETSDWLVVSPAVFDQNGPENDDDYTKGWWDSPATCRTLLSNGEGGMRYCANPATRTTGVIPLCEQCATSPIWNMDPA